LSLACGRRPGAQSVAEIAEAGVGRKAVVAAEHTLANAICANVSNWYAEHYTGGFAYEVHSLRSDASPKRKRAADPPAGASRATCEGVKGRAG
jgi:hypothetical protein